MIIKRPRTVNSTDWTNLSEEDRAVFKSDPSIHEIHKDTHLDNRNNGEAVAVLYGPKHCGRHLETRIYKNNEWHYISAMKALLEAFPQYRNHIEFEGCRCMWTHHFTVL